MIVKLASGQNLPYLGFLQSRNFERMDKKILNNEIVLCRPAVRRARVIVIRKLLKKMKILKSCKVEGTKEKKLRKAERLFKKVNILKKLKDDDVTKFALKNKVLEEFLKGPKIDIRNSALASLAKHESVMKRVNIIREQIPNWEVELPILLNSLGKKKLKKLKPKEATEEKVKRKQLISSEVNEKPRQMNESPAEYTSEISEKITKIDDPFFIEKKVIAPKLAVESKIHDRSHVNKLGKVKPKREVKPSFDTKSAFQLQEPLHNERAEALHPSWAAKKVNLIKPFQGKKIMFSDD